MNIWKKINPRDIKNIDNQSNDGFNSDIWIDKIKKKISKSIFLSKKKNLWNIIYPHLQFHGFY